MILKRLRCRRGQATIEFTFAFLFFFAFLLIMTDMLRVCYNWITLQYAVNEGARFASLGQGMAGLSRDASIEARVIEAAGNLGVNNVTVDITNDSLSISEVAATTTVNLTPFSEIVLNFGGGYDRNYDVVARTAVRNESLF